MLPIGSEVGQLDRIPPGGEPWKGILLASDDPAAWAGTAAFPKPYGAAADWLPAAEAVKAHVAKCREWGWDNTVPVQWDFRDHGKKVYWHKPDTLLPYAEVYSAWKSKQVA